MKKSSIFLLVLLLSAVMFGQEINQYDSAGKRHGVWKKMFDATNILRYEGTFFHGKEVGEFKFYKKIRGKAVLAATKYFNETDETVDVTFFAPKGKIIGEGKMLGKKHLGTWKYYNTSSGRLMTLEYYNDKGALDGERLVYYANGEIAEKQNYVDGKLEGLSYWYSENKVVLKEYIYIDGELHGTAKFYSPKGNLITEGLYKRGKKDGVWKYYENDSLVKTKDYTYIPKYIKKTP